MSGLVVNNLSLAFRGLKALDAVSLRIFPREIVGLIGPNGAGKTSLLNCISRLYQPQSGELFFEGINLLRHSAHQLTGFGIARSFQNIDSQEGITVTESLMLGRHRTLKFIPLGRQQSAYRREARDLLRTVDPRLVEVADEPLDSLPFPIKKKIDVARALASQPRLLLLDEPAGGLSAAEIADLSEVIRGIVRRRKTSVLLVEHKVPLVMSLCDRVVAFDFGKKIAEGTPVEIQNHPAVVEAYLGKVELRERDPRLNSGESTSQVGPLLLEIENIHLHYGPVSALRGVSLEVAPHSITTVLGRNGAGKSSLLKAISGLHSLAKGKVRLDGMILSEAGRPPAPDQIARMGVVQVAEGRRIFTECSVIENLKIAGYLSTRREIDAGMAKVFSYFPRLKEKLHLRYAGNLSGGEQQMLAIGQAIMMKPKLLLLDEPSLGLAPALVAEVFAIIRQIATREKCAILLVEQNVERALAVASFGCVLENGALIRQGPVAELIGDNQIKKLYLG